MEYKMKKYPFPHVRDYQWQLRI